MGRIFEPPDFVKLLQKKDGISTNCWQFVEKDFFHQLDGVGPFRAFWHSIFFCQRLWTFWRNLLLRQIRTNSDSLPEFDAINLCLFKLKWFSILSKIASFNKIHTEWHGFWELEQTDFFDRTELEFNNLMKAMFFNNRIKFDLFFEILVLLSFHQLSGII